MADSGPYLNTYFARNNQKTAIFGLSGQTTRVCWHPRTGPKSRIRHEFIAHSRRLGELTVKVELTGELTMELTMELTPELSWIDRWIKLLN